MKPKLLLLDEPTSALDDLKANQITDLLINITQYTQTSIIMFNHNLKIIKGFSKYILKLD
ncbi:hypothetical protein [Candidatus Atelocyanobacterium thalassae]|uniref:hypothetical protein n=1 Tax=Candidatus Atelocyanobacterium thalassae TaxID=713887 RepID=UPI0028F415BB|nr:hypothetical protein [Candidatus Atelocyanobacterium thalassa]